MPSFAAKFTDRDRTHLEEPRPADLPSDSFMESSGALIGDIKIDVRTIFDENDPREANGLFRLSDRLHVKTKPSTIRAQLLFVSGEAFSARKLAETERALRLLPYVFDARVVPVHFADGKVDIRVITRDVWTLSPGISLGRAGGANNSSFDLQDTNFLGWGKSLEIARSRTIDRTSNTWAWTDSNVRGSRWATALIYVDSSDGKERALQVARPFYSLDSKWSAKLNSFQFNRSVARYNLGKVVDRFNDNQTFYDLNGGLSQGEINNWTRRWLAGVRYDRNSFYPSNSTTPTQQLPADRTLSYPYIGVELIEDQYFKSGDQNQIGRTEDLYFGTDVSAQVGVSAPVLGADRQSLMLAAKARRGFELPGRQQLFVSSDFSTRIEQGQTRNLIADAGASYYWRWRPDWVIFSSLTATVTDSLDADTQLLIGGDNGLRGYPLRYESGASRALWTVEQRFYTDWFPFRLVRVGGALFFDQGRTWGRGVIGNSDPGWLRDAGFGLRFGNFRTGLGNVLHVDFAFPLSNVGGSSKFQLLIQTLQSF